MSPVIDSDGRYYETAIDWARDGMGWNTPAWERRFRRMERERRKFWERGGRRTRKEKRAHA